LWDIADLVLGGIAGGFVAVVARYLFERFRTPRAPDDAALPAEPPQQEPRESDSAEMGRQNAVSSIAAPSAEEAVGFPAPRPAAVRSSERVIRHIYHSGRPEPGGVLSQAFTQRGMTAALGITQSGLTRTLARLEAAGVLRVERRHVVGLARRLKVYLLTPLGETLARSLERTGGSSRPIIPRFK
jgi:DNA-binding PadR family transcriptional regulator